MLKRYSKHPAWFRRWALKFYKSDAWKRLRGEVRLHKKMRCDFCHKLIRGKSICDHIQEISPENYQDETVTLNFNNLRLLCLPCHNTRTFKGVSRSDAIDFDLIKRGDVNLF